MKDWIFKDIKSVLQDKSSLKEFIKIDDIKEMYKYCNKGKDANEKTYDETEFTNKVEKIIENLNENMYDDSEW